MRTLFMKGSILLTIVLSLPSLGAAQRQPLDDYIEQGLKSNIVLQQKNIALERAMLSLKMANGMFAPAISLKGDFIDGDGGRKISLPVGDMLNPVYATLNQLTGTDQFPQIENVNQNFFPRNFYDARVRTSMPLVNTDLLFNRKIKAKQTLLQEYEVDIYKRELVRNIKVAYFSYLAAYEGVKIYEAALARAQEGKRVNESLLLNGKGLPAYVLRSESEIETLRAQWVEAERQASNAKMYFNFFLNRERDADIRIEFNSAAALTAIPSKLQADLSIQKREELTQLGVLTDLSQDIVKMNSLYWSPRLSGFVDLGAQSENLIYTSQSNYYLLGVQLEVPLFAGNINRNKTNQARLDVKQAKLNSALVSDQLDLAAHQSYNSLVSAYQNYLSAQKQFEAAQSYEKLISKGYKEGVNTFIESIDARNQLTSAQLQVTINQYKVLMAAAGLERETADFELK